MRKLIGSAVLMAMLICIGSRAQAAVVWTADFSPSGVANWLSFGTGASLSSSGGSLLLSAPANDWNAGGAYPNSAAVTRVPISLITGGSLNYNITNIGASGTFDIALDEFDNAGTYLGTKLAVVANPGASGSHSRSLIGITYDAGTVTVLPKINFHTTDINQSITIASITFDDGAVPPAPGNTAEVTVTVVNAEVSVELTGTVSFGIVIAGQSAVSSSAIIVRNSGSVNATFKLQLTNPPDWTASTTVGPNQYVLNGAFAAAAAAITWSETNHNLSTASQTCTTLKFAGDENGVGVAADAFRSLWLQFKAPTVVSSESAHTITVTVTAVAQLQ